MFISYLFFIVRVRPLSTHFEQVKVEELVTVFYLFNMEYPPLQLSIGTFTEDRIAREPEKAYGYLVNYFLLQLFFFKKKNIIINTFLVAPRESIYMYKAHRGGARHHIPFFVFFANLAFGCMLFLFFLIHV